MNLCSGSFLLTKENIEQEMHLAADMLRILAASQTAVIPEVFFL